MVLQLLGSDLRKHRLADGVRRSLGILQIEMVLIHLILQRDFQRVQTFFHEILLFVQAPRLIAGTAFVKLRCRQILAGSRSHRRLLNLPEHLSLGPADRAGLGGLLFRRIAADGANPIGIDLTRISKAGKELFIEPGVDLFHLVREMERPLRLLVPLRLGGLGSSRGTSI